MLGACDSLGVLRRRTRGFEVAGLPSQAHPDGSSWGTGLLRPLSAEEVGGEAVIPCVGPASLADGPHDGGCPALVPQQRLVC